MTADALRRMAWSASTKQAAHHLTQALTDPENQPNQYGVEFGMSGQKMHFKIGNQLFMLAYEPDDQQEFEFMKRMLIRAFSTFTPDVKAAPQPSPVAQGDAVAALQPFAEIGAWLFARDLPDETPVVEVRGINGTGWILTRGHFKAAALAARTQAKEGQSHD